MRDVAKLILGCVATLFVASAAVSERQESNTAPGPNNSKAILVELFTSEGCSSCPPADDLLREIDGTQTSTGQLIVGISEHVTYWNSLGWSDPYSSDIYTSRQSSYGKRFGLESVYTPQMVVNGGVEFVGSDRSRLSRAILDQSSQSHPITLRILSTQVEGSMLSLRFSAAGEFPKRSVDITAVLVDDTDRSTVHRGENSGRTLTHVAVARSMQRVATLSDAVEKTVQITIPQSTDLSKGHHLVLFAQMSGYGRVLSVDTARI